MRHARAFPFLLLLIVAGCNGQEAISSPDLSFDPFSASVVPASMADCAKGGWKTYGFRNQGQCVRYVETGKDSRKLAPPPTEGLVAWYPFNGNARDASGNGWDGTVVNAVLTRDRFGVANSAYSFNGVDAQIEFWGFDFAPTTTRNVSISVWVNIRTCGHFVSRYYNLDASRSNFSFYGRCEPSLVGGRAVGTGVDVLDFDMSDATWTHLVAVYRGTAGIVEIYRNGSLLAQGPVTYNSHISPDTPVMFGRVYGPIPGFLGGDLDDIRLYEGALTPSMVQAIYEWER